MRVVNLLGAAAVVIVVAWQWVLYAMSSGPVPPAPFTGFAQAIVSPWTALVAVLWVAALLVLRRQRNRRE